MCLRILFQDIDSIILSRQGKAKLSTNLVKYEGYAPYVFQFQLPMQYEFVLQGQRIKTIRNKLRLS